MTTSWRSWLAGMMIAAGMVPSAGSGVMKPAASLPIIPVK